MMIESIHSPLCSSTHGKAAKKEDNFLRISYERAFFSTMLALKKALQRKPIRNYPSDFRIVSQQSPCFKDTKNAFETALNTNQ